MTSESVKDLIPELFESLGYKVHEDHSIRLGRRWWEICDDRGLIAQIDCGVPIEHLIEDFTCWHEGREATSASDYEVCGPQDNPRYAAMLAAVARYARERTSTPATERASSRTGSSPQQS